MSIIIPYDDSLEVGKTAFIMPNNKIIITSLKHEEFAANYCEGEDYRILYSRLENGELIDPFASSKLTKEELILYKHWLEQNNFNKRKMCSDFLVDVLGFDKILTKMRKSITTTSFNPHIRFYNYYLMDWYIDIRQRVKYNDETGIFELEEPKISLFKSNEDRKMEEELDEIKAKVKLKDRHYFFK